MTSNEQHCRCRSISNPRVLLQNSTHPTWIDTHRETMFTNLNYRKMKNATPHKHKQQRTSADEQGGEQNHSLHWKQAPSECPKRQVLKQKKQKLSRITNQFHRPLLRELRCSADLIAWPSSRNGTPQHQKQTRGESVCVCVVSTAELAYRQGWTMHFKDVGPPGKGQNLPHLAKETADFLGVTLLPFNSARILHSPAPSSLFPRFLVFPTFNAQSKVALWSSLFWNLCEDTSSSFCTSANFLGLFQQNNCIFSHFSQICFSLNFINFYI